MDRMKKFIQKKNFQSWKLHLLYCQAKWELLKYEIRKFAINFSRKPAQNSRKLQTDLETKIKNLEQNITDEDKFKEYKNREKGIKKSLR